MFVEVLDTFGCRSKLLIDTFFRYYKTQNPKLTLTKSSSGCVPFNSSMELKIDTFQSIEKVDWTSPGVSSIVSNQNMADVIYTDTGQFDIYTITRTLEGCEYFDTFKEVFMAGKKEKIELISDQKSNCASSAISYSLGNANLDYTWDIWPSTYSKLDSGSRNVKISFEEVGTYNVRLQASNLGCITDTTIIDFVNVLGPIGSFEKSHGLSCFAPDTFKYWDRTSYPLSGTNKRIWNIYDKNGIRLSTNSKDSFDLILTNTGYRGIELITSNTNGCSDTLFKDQSAEIKPIKAEINLPDGQYCPLEDVPFSANNPVGDPTKKNKYKWTFYDLDNSTVLARSYSQDTSISYMKEGSYGVKLVVYNDQGFIDSISFFDTIHVASPEVEIFIPDNEVCNGEVMQFSAKYHKRFKDFNSSWFFKNRNTNRNFAYFDKSALSLTFRSPGVYDLKFILKSPNTTCETTIDSLKAFTVEGRNVQIIDSGVGVCNPGTVKLHAKTLYVIGENNPALSTRSWKGLNQEVINKPIDSVIYVRINDNQSHMFQYNFSSSNGCKDSVRHSIQLGINSNFGFSKGRPCLFETIKALLYKSPVTPQTYFWYSDSSHKVDVIDGNTATPKFFIKKPGYIPITTVQSYAAGCSDTTTKLVYLPDRKIELSSEDTILNCAPQIATFNIKTNFANRLEMSFGDGPEIEKVRIGEYSHLYQLNSGPPGFDILLTGSDQYGCKDTVDLKSYIKVLGPVVDIDVVPNLGCEKLRVRFLNNSKYYTSVKSAFGDGSALDSSDIGYHDYRVFANPVQEVFKPFFIVSDGVCQTPKYYPNDSVIVFKKPEAALEPNNKIGCTPLTVDFKNFSRYSNDYQWDFDGDGIIDSDEFRPRHIYKTSGVYRPILIAKNFNNCYDTIVYADSINVLKSPNASFIIPSDTFCAKDSFDFIDNSSGGFKITEWLWNYGDPNTTFDTSTMQNPRYAYTHPGSNIINLKVTDSLGCTDTTARRMVIHDTLLPDKPEVAFVSVEGSDIYMKWNSFRPKKFDRYALAEDFSGYRLITFKYDIKDSSYLILNQEVDKGALCFSVSYFDSCNFQSAYDESHCAPVLNTYDSVGYNQILLKWTRYVGWDFDIHYYNIYRSKDNGPYERIGNVVGNIQYYLDDSLFEHNYCYYVEAVHKNGKYKSKSNVSCSGVRVIKPTSSPRLKRATVELNSSVLVEWEKDTTLPIFGGYVLARNGTSNLITIFDTFAYDYSAKVTDESYKYRVRVKDLCENYGSYSNVGKTILLTGEGGDFSTELDWTAYEDWENGVEEYIIELANEFGEFESLAVVNGSTLDYVDKENHIELEDSFCYRIIAVKKDQQLDSSYSNISCLAPNSVLFVPSGFTPNNGDNLNNEFIPFSAFLFDKKGDKLRSYEFSVYNRWGELMFRTSNPKEGWNGEFKGEMAPLGAYLYSVKAVGLDGKAHQRNGYVTLIR